MKTTKINFDHFKSLVPNAIKQKMLLIAELAKDEIINNCNSGELIIECENIGTIEGNYVSGWMPNQDGGYESSAFYRNEMDSSYHFTEKQKDYNSEQYENMLKDFCLDNDIEYSELDNKKLSEELQEKMYEYERDYFEEALLSFEIFADCADSDSWSKKLKSAVTMRLSINYKDAPYYRQKYAENIKQVILSFDEFLDMPESGIINQFKL